MIINGNSLEELKKFPDNYFHSVVTDPPYGLVSITKRFGKVNSAPAKFGSDGVFQRKAKGFMGKEWDGSGIEYNIELWQEVFRVLKEGGYLLAFGGTRTHHKLATSIEDAGFEIRDMIAWVYGSGFPKSHNIGKALDKNNGQSKIELKFVKWYRTVGISAKETNKIIGTKDTGSHYLRLDQPYLPTKESWRKLKPHIKMEIPYWVDKLIKRVGAEREIIEKKRVQRNSSSWNSEGMLGVGEQNFDITIPKTEQAKQWEGWGTALKPALEPITMARKPFKGTVAENVLTNGVGGINIDGCRIETKENLNGGAYKEDGENVAHKSWGYKPKVNKEKYEQPIGRFPANFIHDGSDEVKDLFPNTKSGGGGKFKNSVFAGGYETDDTDYKDSGSAARYFYCAKASKKDRNEGLEDFEEKEAPKFSGGEETREDKPSLRPKMANHHPTVKPTDLMRYLVRLVTPKNGIVLDCFMGSGSTGKACALEGFEFVGIDLDKDYCEIAKARIDKALEDKKQAEAQQELF